MLDWGNFSSQAKARPSVPVLGAAGTHALKNRNGNPQNRIEIWRAQTIMLLNFSNARATKPKKCID